jgi:hypothetical protein
VNLTAAIVAVLGFESQKICPASQFVISVAEPLQLVNTQAGRRLTSEPVPAFW